jgi:phycocyanin-associated, rod
MLGQSSISRGSGAVADSRIFVYEVTGLHQNDATTQCDPQIRTSSNTFMQVPMNRMNDTMQRITNLGGKIVSIHPLSQSAAPAAKKSQPQAKESQA